MVRRSEPRHGTSRADPLDRLFSSSDSRAASAGSCCSAPAGRSEKGWSAMSTAKVFDPAQKKAQKPVKGAAEGPVTSPLLKVRPFAEAKVEAEGGRKRDLFGEYVQRRAVAAATDGGGALGGQGQQQHLPHETWQVMRQVQGRVKPPTLDVAKGGDSSKASLNTVTSYSNSAQLVVQRFLAAGDSYFDSDDFVIVNDIGQFLKRGHAVVKLSELASAEWPPEERMLVITGHGDENEVAGLDPEQIAKLIASSSVPEAIPIVLLSCDSAKDRGDGTNLSKDVFDILERKRTITGFKGSAILDASAEVMKIVSIREDRGHHVAEAQEELEGTKKPQEGVSKLALGAEKDPKFYKDAVDLPGMAGFFAEFLERIEDSIDQTGCVTYNRD